MSAKPTAALGSISRPTLQLGGPGEPHRALRDLLARRIRDVPSGGRISWVTYYFRDRDLAADLIVAHRRGVDVRVLLEGRPRTRRANQAVIDLLRPVLRDKLRVVGQPYARRIHAKLYLFSGASGGALIGSFNPSGDRDELDPRVIGEIGDQDRGFNALVEVADEARVAWLFAQVDELRDASFLRFGRSSLAKPRAWSGAGEDLWFLPRSGGSPLIERLDSLAPKARVRITATHLSGSIAASAFARLAKRGARVDVLADSTARRVPPALEARVRAAGVAFTRMPASDHVPMHAKFMLIEDRAEREAFFGSANWSDRSLRRNFELLARSRDPWLFEELADYWDRIERFARSG